MGKDKKERLFLKADSQQGYFTSQQAEECGYSRSNFHRFTKSKEWIKEIRGVYRLSHYPIQDRPELVLWSLWSRNKKGKSQGVWSYETALDIHELSDVMPAKMHMTVPVKFRRRSGIPKVLLLHHGNLKKIDIEERQGYRVTTPLKTLIDVINAGTIADNFILQAARQALQRGIIIKKELQALKKTHPNVYKKLKELFGEHSF